MVMSLDIGASTRDLASVPNNGLLTVLSDKDLFDLQCQLESVPLAAGTILFDVDQPLTRLYFLETGVAALLSTIGDLTVGVATVGREGGVDVHTLLLGGASSPGRCQVLVPGTALALDVAAFRSALERFPELRTACEGFIRGLLVQILHSVPCNRLHTAEQRCARWLLMCADRTDEDAFEIAPETLSLMLGVEQPTAAAAIRKLQGSGLISCRKGAIKLLDRRGLESTACECYRIVREREQRILPPSSPQGGSDPA